MGKKYNKGRGGSGKRGGTPKHTAKATVKKGSKARLARFGKIAKQGQWHQFGLHDRGTILRRLQLTLKDFRDCASSKGVPARPALSTTTSARGVPRPGFHAIFMNRLDLRAAGTSGWSLFRGVLPRRLRHPAAGPRAVAEGVPRLQGRHGEGPEKCRDGRTSIARDRGTRRRPNMTYITLSKKGTRRSTLHSLI